MLDRIPMNGVVVVSTRTFAKLFSSFAFVCLAGTAVWAGTEYPARPGESVVANELIVRMRPGVHAATVAPNYLPGARVDSLGKEQLYKISVSTGISTAAASRLALD